MRVSRLFMCGRGYEKLHGNFLFKGNNTTESFYWQLMRQKRQVSVNGIDFLNVRAYN